MLLVHPSFRNAHNNKSTRGTPKGHLELVALLSSLFMKLKFGQQNHISLKLVGSLESV